MPYIDELGIRAQKAKEELIGIDTDKKNNALKLMAELLIKNSKAILDANNKDVVAARIKNTKESLVDRLILNTARIEGMANGLLEASMFTDPIGKILYEKDMPQGMKLKKISVPMGVIGIIYESRPNVTADAAGLCFKAGSVVILRGGSDAINSNKAIVKVLRDALGMLGINMDSIQLIEDTSRDTATQMMKADNYIDLLIPRGGADLIASVIKNATIPVIETGTGNCHLYIDRIFNEKYAIDIVLNAKCSRPGVCNAIETLLVHKDVYTQILPRIETVLSPYNVQLRACERSIKVLKNAIPAVQDDWVTEFLDYILAVKVVDSIDEAIRHINKYGTKHSEGIITDIAENKKKFQEMIDAACVYINTSTRFTDGGEFGLGAEIGISTQKLHARGPMGANEITTYKYIIEGNGQIR
ncbi:MAG: Gamma-glutamyl phosphate reductase [Firmicutes bacterium ADurb.Bin146]|nr:MAG: Gamma-glutamyl phosphate reductase [Firmicutes bacterium ADurb.Bin146]